MHMICCNIAIMMTLSNIFRVTGLLCGEFIGHYEYMAGIGFYADDVPCVFKTPRAMVWITKGLDRIIYKYMLYMLIERQMSIYGTETIVN